MIDSNTLITLLSIGVITIAAGFVHSAIGFGFGIVALAAIPMVLDIKSSHIVISLSCVPMLTMASWSYRDGTEWRALRTSVTGAVVFLPVGVLAFEVAPLDLLVRGTGLAILLMVLLNLRKPQSPKAIKGQSMRSCFLAGSVSGFLAGAVSIAGPPVAAFALKQNWSQQQFKAFVTHCLLAISVYKSILLAIRGLVTPETATQSLVAAPFAIIGVQLGVIASRRISAKRFKRIVAIALVLAACQMLLRGSPSPPTTGPQNPESQKTPSQSLQQQGPSPETLPTGPSAASRAVKQWLSERNSPA